MSATDTTTKRPQPTELVRPVLDDLARLVEQVRPEQFGDPTPCPGYTVGGMRDHILAWVTYFAAAAQDPDGDAGRPDPAGYRAPEDPAEAAVAVREAADQMDAAIAAGVADREVLMVQSKMPGGMLLAMALGEFCAHGWDLASGARLPWSPPPAAATVALDSLSGMLTDEYRGEGKDFGERVEVPDDAPPLHRLLGFSGRDPNWTPPAG